MDRKIKNWEQLLDHGVTASRTFVLELTEQVLERLDSYKRIKELISLKGNLLKIGTRTWDLERKRNVYLIGAGEGMQCHGKGCGGCAGGSTDRWDYHCEMQGGGCVFPRACI